MNRYALAGMALLALGGTAFADGFIGMGGFSGGETVIDFNTTDMTTLGSPTANIGNGITVTNSGGGTGGTGWRGNIDWSTFFDNIPGASLGRALGDGWGASDLLYDFTGAGNPNRAGMLLSTGTATTWTVDVYGPSFNHLASTNVTMPGAQDAVFVGYEASGGIGYIQLTDVENGYITIMDDVRFESTGGGGNVIIDFQALEHNDNLVADHGTVVTEDGFQVTKGQGEPFNFATFGTQVDRYPGSTALFNNTVNGLIKISAIDGHSFDVQSIDFANLNSPGTVAIHLVGNKTGGGQVTQTINHTDPDGILPLDLVTYNLTGFSGLDSIEWTQESSFHQFDNVVISSGNPSISLSVRGTCPGSVTVSWSGAQPNSTVALIFAKNTGSFVIPFGPCQGTVLGLGANQIRLVNTFGAGSNGSGSRSGQAGSSACRGYLQMHDIPNCTLSNVAQLP